MATVDAGHGELVLFAVPEALAASLESTTTEKGGEDPPPEPRKKSVFGRLNDKQRELVGKRSGKHQRFVRMPREEYNKYFARDEKGRYCGTEPEGCDAGKEVLKLCLENNLMQQVGQKDVEAEIVRDWKPFKERKGWAQVPLFWG